MTFRRSPRRLHRTGRPGGLDAPPRPPRSSRSAAGDPRAIRTIVASGKAAGTLTADSKLARRYLDLGASFVAVGIDLTLLARATCKLAEEFGVGTLTSLPVAGPLAY